jgi:TolA-binding protein
VSEGKVRAESDVGRAVAVEAGESLRSDDPRLAAPPAPQAVPAITLPRLPASRVEAPPAAPDCADARSIAARRACYERAAQGHDVAAQNALYGLGLMEQDEAHDGVAALEAFRRYEARFPQGVFAPEASLAILGELLAEKRYPEALQETEHSLALGDESGQDRVRFVRAQLLLGPLDRPALALPLLHRLVDSGEPTLREEALFSLGLCQEVLGQPDEAEATLRRSLAAYPEGKHAAQIRARLR